MWAAAQSWASASRVHVVKAACRNSMAFSRLSAVTPARAGDVKGAEAGGKFGLEALTRDG